MFFFIVTGHLERRELVAISESSSDDSNADEQRSSSDGEDAPEDEAVSASGSNEAADQESEEDEADADCSDCGKPLNGESYKRPRHTQEMRWLAR